MKLMKCFLMKNSINDRHFVDLFYFIDVDVEESSLLQCGISKEVCLRYMM